VNKLLWLWSNKTLQTQATGRFWLVSWSSSFRSHQNHLQISGCHPWWGGCLVLGSILFLFLVGLGFELRAFMLAKQVLYCLNYTSSPFCCVILETESCRLFIQTLVLSISASQVELQVWATGAQPWDFDSVDLGLRLRICTDNKAPGDADAIGSGIILQETLLFRSHTLVQRSRWNRLTAIWDPWWDQVWWWMSR
jgi:hypothetical protein